MYQSYRILVSIAAVLGSVLVFAASSKAAEDDGKGSSVKSREVVTVNERGWITRTVLREEIPDVGEPMYYGFVSEERSHAATSGVPRGESSYSSYYYSPEQGVSHFEPPSPSSRYWTPDGWSSVPMSRYFWTPDGWFEAW